MKTIGLIGGMSWQSSLEYYRIINETVNEKLGGMHSAKSLLFSVDFEKIEHLQRLDRWDELTKLMIEAAQNLEKGGADLVVICTNTMHRTADAVQENIGIPLLHIADVTAERIRRKGWGKVGLLGTLYTMEQDFYKNRLQNKFGIEVLVPEKNDRSIVHEVIYRELSFGIKKISSKIKFADIINKLSNRGADAVILGCTEIPLLIGRQDVEIPLLDTTRIHAESAVEYALA